MLDLHVVQVARDQAIAESLAKAAEIARLQSEVDRHLGTIAECRERIQGDETIRRKLHNTIQELKGVCVCVCVCVCVGGGSLVCHHPEGGESFSLGRRALSLHSGSGGVVGMTQIVLIFFFIAYM